MTIEIGSIVNRKGMTTKKSKWQEEWLHAEQWGQNSIWQCTNTLLSKDILVMYIHATIWQFLIVLLDVREKSIGFECLVVSLIKFHNDSMIKSFFSKDCLPWLSSYWRNPDCAQVKIPADIINKYTLFFPKEVLGVWPWRQDSKWSTEASSPGLHQPQLHYLYQDWFAVCCHVWNANATLHMCRFHIKVTHERQHDWSNFYQKKDDKLLDMLNKAPITKMMAIPLQ